MKRSKEAFIQYFLILLLASNKYRLTIEQLSAHLYWYSKKREHQKIFKKVEIRRNGTYSRKY